MNERTKCDRAEGLRLLELSLEEAYDAGDDATGFPFAGRAVRLYDALAKHFSGIDSDDRAKLNEPFGDSGRLRQAAAGFLAASFYPEGSGYTDKMRQTYGYWHKRLVAELQPNGAMDYGVAEAAAVSHVPQGESLNRAAT